MKDIDEDSFCLFGCKYRNYYDGWCYYNNEDADSIYECEYAKKMAHSTHRW